MNINEIMRDDVISCAPDDTIREVAMKMHRHDCGLVVVIEPNGGQKPVGVLTDRDIVCRVVAPGDDVAQVYANEVMSKDLVNINYQATVNAATHLMKQHRLRRLIVTSDMGEVLGVVSITDLARVVADKKLGAVVQDLAARYLR